METAEAILDRYKAIKLRLEGPLYPPIPRERVFRPVEDAPAPRKARTLYQEPIGPDRPPTTPREALRYICRLHGLSVDEVLGKSRATQIVRARRAVVIWIHGNWKSPSTKKPWSTVQLGRFMNRDHSTIVHILGKRSTRKPTRGVHEMIPTHEEKQLDAGGKAIREHEMAGRITRPWEILKPYQKKPWVAKAEVVLKAALAINP